MDPTRHPVTMKTGNDLLFNEDSQDDDLLLNVAATMGILTEKSLESAELYCKHANRNVILGEDILIALKFQAHVFFNLPGVKEDCVELKKEIRSLIDEEKSDEEGDEESDEESDESDESDEEIDEESDTWTESLCECGRCKAMNKFNKEWCDWIPEDSFQKLIKKSIDDTVDRFK